MKRKIKILNMFDISPCPGVFDVLDENMEVFSIPGDDRRKAKDSIRDSDVISIHVHLTPENRGLINADSFSRMKPGAVLVNTSRGAIVDEKAFLNALETGGLSAAGIDVIDGEWNDNLKEHRLIRYADTHENLVITPHLGGVTFEAQKATIEFTVLKLRTKLRLLMSLFIL